MSKTKTIFAACVSITLATGAASAQQAPAPNGASQTTNQLPEQCRRVMQNMPQECMSLMQNMSATRNMGMVQESMGAGATPGTSQTTTLPAHVRENTAVMNKMHADMAKDASIADPDEAFTRAMIPHHQAAIEMARIVLKHGKDEHAKKLANDVIREQAREIADMEEWLKKRAR